MGNRFPLPFVRPYRSCLPLASRVLRSPGIGFSSTPPPVLLCLPGSYPVRRRRTLIRLLLSGRCRGCRGGGGRFGLLGLLFADLFRSRLRLLLQGGQRNTNARAWVLRAVRGAGKSPPGSDFVSYAQRNIVGIDLVKIDESLSHKKSEQGSHRRWVTLYGRVQVVVVAYPSPSTQTFRCSRVIHAHAFLRAATGLTFNEVCYVRRVQESRLRTSGIAQFTRTNHRSARLKANMMRQ